MHKLLIIPGLLCISGAHAAPADMPAQMDLNIAISDVQIYCSGLADEFNHLKTMAGINTAVTGVGTAAGAGATAVGIVKAAKDKELDAQREAAIAELEAQGYEAIETPEEFAEIFGGFLAESGDPDIEAAGKALQEKSRLEKESKNLGNWRTGLLAANTATNIAGTVIAATNKVGNDLQLWIDDCKAAVDHLSKTYMQARLEPETDASQISHAKEIIDICGEWSMFDSSSINTKAKGAMISSGVGAGVGLTGTIVSAMANTDPVRNDNSVAGMKKEKNLNTTANIMAGGATVASGVATVFNATQIGAINKAANLAKRCEEVLW